MTARHRGAVRAMAPLLVGVALLVAVPPAHADPGVGRGDPGGAAVQAAVGTLTIDEVSGTDTTILHGSTDGTCDVPGSAEQPVDGFNAVISGPGVFAPDPARGRPDGQVVVSTTDTGFSTTDPIRFTFRTHLRELAEELGGPLRPGDHVVTFRCVNQFDGVVHQTFSATLTFTGGPPATAFTVTGAGAPPAPAAAPGAVAGPGRPVPVAADPATGPGASPPAAAPERPSTVPALLGGAAAALAAALVLFQLTRRKRARRP